MNFNDLNLDRKTVEALRRMDVTEPSPIQAAAIPELMAGRDVVGQARTGSGKTLAFSLPLLSICDPSLAAAQALILVPTRELAGQVARVIDQLTPSIGLRAAQIYGGRDMSDQIQLLNTGPQIIIGTPGRVLDHLYRGTLSLRDIRIMVLDEADQMLDQGFGPDVDLILDCAPEIPQMALFSATLPQWVHDIIQHRLHDPAIISVDSRKPVESVEHTVIEVPQNRKIDALSELLDERGRGNVVVFARTKIGVEKLDRQLRERGYQVASLQGNLGQAQRERVLRGFRRGNPPILVATNVAARGLDITSIEQVINFDLPESAELLTHRLGRTGRMGRHGTAVTLVTPADAGKFRSIERELGLKIRRERWGTTPEPRPAEESGAPVAEGFSPQSREAAARAPRTGSANGNRRRGNRGPRPQYEAVCESCKKETTVPFQPRAGRPVYCSDCFKQRKESAA